MPLRRLSRVPSRAPLAAALLGALALSGCAAAPAEPPRSVLSELAPPEDLGEGLGGAGGEPGATIGLGVSGGQLGAGPLAAGEPRSFWAQFAIEPPADPGAAARAESGHEIFPVRTELRCADGAGLDEASGAIRFGFGDAEEVLGSGGLSLAELCGGAVLRDEVGSGGIGTGFTVPLTLVLPEGAAAVAEPRFPAGLTIDVTIGEAEDGQ